MVCYTGRGLMTKKSIVPGEIIVSIPKATLLTMETVLESDVGGFIKRSPVRLNLQQAMSIFLVTEWRKQQDSIWWHYIKVLPETYDTPAFWTSSDIELLPKSVLSKTKKDLGDLQLYYKEVVRMLSDCTDNSIDYEDFRWAWYCINSRSIYYVNQNSSYFSDKNRNIALAPFLDLLNHSTTAVVNAAFNKETNCYEIKTHNRYKKYDQVFISYGPHSNTHLLLEYGFILPNNPHDVYEIDYDSIQIVAKNFNLQLIERKNLLIIENELYKKLVCSMEGISWNLHVMLRILAMSFTELKSWKLVFDGGEISANNEKLVKQMARQLLCDELSKVTTGFDKFVTQDYQKLTLHQRIAYDLTVTQQQILQRSLKLL